MSKIIRESKVYFVVNGPDRYGPFTNERTARIWATDAGLWQVGDDLMRHKAMLAAGDLARKPE